MVTRVKVGSNVIPLVFPTKRRLNRDDPVVRDSTTEQPHRDARLTHTLSGHDRELVGERGLSARNLDSSLTAITAGAFDIGLNSNGIGGHRDAFNTASVIGVNTRSVFDAGQTLRMPRNGEISEFWHRLTQARSSCEPPKSMRQADIAKEYRGSEQNQSTVTKWKTGKSMPEPETVVRMARDANVNVNWLWAGQGDMRPLPVTDPVVKEIVDAVNGLTSVDSKLQVLRAAVAQKALEEPGVAARLASAERTAKEFETNKHGRRQRSTAQR